VKHVRNITDVDDKTIRGAQAAGQTLAAFTQQWTDKFHRDCQALGLLAPHVEPSAVAHIPQQVAMIKALVDRGHAYVAKDGSVYFKVCTCKDYGKLTHLDFAKLETQGTNSAGEANDADEYERESASDFALWKSRKPEDGANFWPSPWGEGRPGWHVAGAPWGDLRPARRRHRPVLPAPRERDRADRVLHRHQGFRGALVP
jgi:cysteinyl-tRNA synthetase